MVGRADTTQGLPAGWTSRGSRLRLSVHAKVKSPAMSGGGGLSLHEIVEVDFEAALGEQSVTLSELRVLARLKAPLVRARGQWVFLDVQEIARATALLESGTRKMTAQDTVRMALDATTVDGVGVGGVSADGWLSGLLQQLKGNGHIEKLAAPAGFSGVLRPYQVRGYSWLGFLRRWGLGACLADDMGLGKTIQTLALIQHEWETSRRERRPTLLICPMSVVGNWQQGGRPVHARPARHGPPRPAIAPGRARVREAGRRARPGPLELLRCCTATSRRWPKFTWSESGPRRGAEHQEPRDQAGPGRARAQGGYRIALTGTPVENHVGDLWSIMEFLNPGWLGTQAEFKRTFLVPIQAEHDPMPRDRLKKLTAPFILRRLKTDKAIIADLPEKLEMKVFCTLTKEQASLYAAVVAEASPELESAEGIQRKGLVLATLSKLKQVCNHPAQFLGDNSAIAGRSGKLARLTEMLEEVLEAGDRALVFTQFAEMGEILKRHLQETFGREVLFLHGGVPKAQRDRMVERFQARGRRRAADLHPVAQGGRHRAEPDGRQPRLPLRSLVEPGGREPGDRPRLPDRPDPAACRSTSSCAPGRSEEKIDAMIEQQARGRRRGRRQRRGLAHEAVERRAAGAVRVASRRGRGSMTIRGDVK